MELPNPTSKQPRQQLSKGMEHMRYAVTVDPIPRPNSSSSPTPASTDSDAYGVPATYEPVRRPANRSHDPSNNQKRTDPFAFGSRYLEEGDDIFEFNAWDHVEVDASYREFSEAQYEKQREAPVSDFDKKRFNDKPEKWWDLFYKNNKENFFKNRKWLAQEFPILNEITKEGYGNGEVVRVLEVGAGAGNTAFPILKMNKNQGLRVHACDFSKKAVEVMRAHEAYDERFMRADVWDAAALPDSDNGGLPPGIEEGSVDVVLMIFIFSALSPKQWDQAIRNVWKVLKPGGQVLFRDYGRGDLAQVRFKKGRWMEENFYVRGDGTRVYFFEREELESIWSGKGRPSQETDGDNSAEKQAEGITSQVKDLSLGAKEQKKEEAESETPKTSEKNANDLVELTPSFEIVHFGVDRRMLVNRQRRLKMYRCWMQAVFRKPASNNPDFSTRVPTSTIRQDKAVSQKEDAEAAKEGS